MLIGAPIARFAIVMTIGSPSPAALNTASAMNSRPWLAVAVYDRAPVADAPIATDIAANSDSTLMNSQPGNSPVRVISPSASTMCVCGEIGYAQITSGRHSATASATAREPSICFSMDDLPGERLLHVVVRLGRGGDVRGGDLRRELLADRVEHRFEMEHAADRGEAAEQRDVRHRPPDVLHRDVGRGDD